MLPAALKQTLRPWVWKARRTRQRLQAWVSPPTRWNGRHHPVFERFEPWSGIADGRFLYDFLGIRTDPRFRFELHPQPAGPLQTHYPHPHAAYFELAFVLESVLARADAPVFRMMELGAGYGVWQVTVHRALELCGGGTAELIGVEMGPRQFKWMLEHFRNNGIDPARHTLIHGAVSNCDGEAVFRAATIPSLGYGQRLQRRWAGTRGISERTVPSSDGCVPVRCLDLRQLLQGQSTIDLLHVDIQGEELRAIVHAWDELERRVERVAVGTHSGRIHRRLRSQFEKSGWRCRYDFGFRARCRTEFGHVQFGDGLLAYINPGLEARR